MSAAPQKQHVIGADIPAMVTTAADAAMQPDAVPMTDAIEGPIVVKSDVLAEPDTVGALQDQKPVEEVAAAVALVGDKRSAEAEAHNAEGPPSKRVVT